MESPDPNRRVGRTVIALLALAQITLGVLRTLQWLNVGSDLMGQGVLFLPLLGVIAFVRGAFVAVLTLLYVTFAYGAFMGRGWSRLVGQTAAIVNLLLGLSVLFQGETLARVIGWSIIPVIIIIYYWLTPEGRQTPKEDSVSKLK